MLLQVGLGPCIFSILQLSAQPNVSSGSIAVILEATQTLRLDSNKRT